MENKRFIIDIESNGLKETATAIHCIVLKDIVSEEILSFDSDRGNLYDCVPYLQKCKELIGHNIIDYDIPVIEKILGITIEVDLFDTLLASRFSYPNLITLDSMLLNKGLLNSDSFKVWRQATSKEVSAVGSHSLEAWGIRLGFNKSQFGRDCDWSVFTQGMLDYCIQDTAVTLKLYDKLIGRLDRDLQDALNLEFEVQKIISKQVEHGWKFDVEKAYKLYGTLAERREVLVRDLQEVFPGWYQELKTPEYYSLDFHGHGFQAVTKKAVEDMAYKELNEMGEKVTRKSLQEYIIPGPNRRNHIPFNPASRQHIAKALKELHNWKPTKFTPSGQPQVDETVLSSLKYPEAKLLAEFFMVNKRLGQLSEGENAWLKLVDKDGYIHGGVNVLGTDTHRATHSRPNLAQVPACDKPFGKECRELFTVPEGYTQVGTDASGQELRCLSHYMALYDNGEYAKEVVSGDIHTKNQKAAGLPERSMAKTLIYGMIYGAGNEKIGKIVGKGAKAGANIKQMLYDNIPALKRVMTDMANDYNINGKFILSLDGRKLYPSEDYKALNYTLQSTGAVLTKRWMVFINQMAKEKHINFQQLGFIHDELQFQVKDKHVEEFRRICKDAMKKTEKYYNFRCELDCDTMVGQNWKECH